MITFDKRYKSPIHIGRGTRDSTYFYIRIATHTSRAQSYCLLSLYIGRSRESLLLFQPAKLGKALQHPIHTCSHCPGSLYCLPMPTHFVIALLYERIPWLVECVKHFWKPFFEGQNSKEALIKFKSGMKRRFRILSCRFYYFTTFSVFSASPGKSNVAKRSRRVSFLRICWMLPSSWTKISWWRRRPL